MVFAFKKFCSLQDLLYCLPTQWMKGECIWAFEIWQQWGVISSTIAAERKEAVQDTFLRFEIVRSFFITRRKRPRKQSVWRASNGSSAGWNPPVYDLVLHIWSLRIRWVIVWNSPTNWGIHIRPGKHTFASSSLRRLQAHKTVSQTSSRCHIHRCKQIQWLIKWVERFVKRRRNRFYILFCFSFAASFLSVEIIRWNIRLLWMVSFEKPSLWPPIHSTFVGQFWIEASSPLEFNRASVRQEVVKSFQWNFFTHSTTKHSTTLH